MEIGFSIALVLVGVVLVAAAGLSGLFHGTVLSISVLSVIVGSGLALAGVISPQAGDPGLIYVIELALLITLFTDGLVVEREMVATHWAPPARALVVALPITLLLIALGAKLLFVELSWVEALLLGAVLAPTDPVVTSTVVTAERVPPVIRHTLNLESGLNDGLALPGVLVLLAIAMPTGGGGSEVLAQVAETAIGALVGAALALVAGRALDHLPGDGIEDRYEGVYAIGLALLAFGLADVAHGNGLIAAFVAGIVLAVSRHELPDAFSHFNENVTAIFSVVTFALFGGMIVGTGYEGSLWALVVFVPFVLVVARPLAVVAAFTGSSLPRAQVLFIAWFGPKGVASMLFALFVLNSTVGERTIVFDAASFVILGSIVAHGLTDTLGARWIERRVNPDTGR